MRLIRIFAVLLLIFGVAGSTNAVFRADAQGSVLRPTTAWRDGNFNIDVRVVVARSNIILQRPNLQREESMPLGNGRLGLAVWSQECFTAQLNRQDTLPKRLSPGQIVIPGLCKLTNAADFAGHLDLYNGEFVERGGGMTAVTYVDDQLDVMVVDVKGADPKVLQSAELRLWSPRKPEVAVESDLGALAETWQDTNELGSTGLTFGSLAAITSDGSDQPADGKNHLSPAC
jgi:alpha-L-fucosidase 2